LQGWSNDDWV